MPNCLPPGVCDCPLSRVNKGESRHWETDQEAAVFLGRFDGGLTAAVEVIKSG